MEMKGEYRIARPQALVWQALNDPQILKASVPGCEELIRSGETGFKGRIAAAVGPVRAKFSGEATLTDIDPPNGYTLTGSGSGGAAGLAKGGAKVMLRAEGDETVLTYEASAQVAGKLAQIGSRLVDMAAKKMADEFFGNFARQLEPMAELEPAGTPAPAETQALEAAIVPQADPTPSPEPVASEPVTPEPVTAEPAVSGLTASPPGTISTGRQSWIIWAVAALAGLVIVAFWMGYL